MRDYNSKIAEAIYILILLVIFFGTIIAINYIGNKIEEKENTVEKNNIIVDRR